MSGLWNWELDLVYCAYKQCLRSHLNGRHSCDNTWKLVIDCTCIWGLVDWMNQSQRTSIQPNNSWTTCSACSACKHCHSIWKKCCNEPRAKQPPSHWIKKPKYSLSEWALFKPNDIWGLIAQNKKIIHLWFNIYRHI